MSRPRAPSSFRTEGNGAGLPGEPAPDDRKFVTALARGLDVLQAFDGEEVWLGNQEIAKRCDLAKPTVSRLTYTLTQLGHLHYDEASRKYCIGVGVISLAQPILRKIELRHLVKPMLQEFADKVNAAVGLGTSLATEALYLEVCRGAEAVTLRLTPGSRLDLATSAMGRALYVAMNDAEREAVLRAYKARDPENFRRISRGLDSAVADVQERGFCMSASDWSPDVNGVGVPIRLRQGGLIFALNCGGAAWNLPVSKLESELGPGLVALGDRIASTHMSMG